MYSQRAEQLNSSFIRDILTVSQQPGVISFAGGLPDPSLFPLQPLKAAINQPCVLPTSAGTGAPARDKAALAA